jgi:hypothetical protein
MATATDPGKLERRMEVMADPIDTVMAFHNAFRRDIAAIDAAALAAARGKPGLAAAVERFRFLNEVLVWHATGEELAIFPALEAVAPLVAEAYLRDHRGLDANFEALSDAVSARDPLQTARATAVFRFHLHHHLDKEDAHLYRLIRERVSAPERDRAVGVLASVAPYDRFPEIVAWLFPLLGPDDRANVARDWQMRMPAEAFAGAMQIVRKAVGDDWAELTRRVPEPAA